MSQQQNYIKELIDEIAILDPDTSMYTIKLLEDEIYRVRIKASKKEAAEEEEKKKKDGIIKLSEKIVVPVDKYPGYNFIGKIMGPKASILKRLESKTKATILILGKGSIKDQSKEKILRETGEPRHAHFKEPLHIVINVHAPKSVAAERLAAAVVEVNKYMDPDNEEVKQESIRTLAQLHPITAYPIPANGISPGMRAPIIRVGIPPPGAIALSGKSLDSSGVKTNYIYDGKYDGTYEGYPSTSATTPEVGDALGFELIKPSTKVTTSTTSTFTGKRTISAAVLPHPLQKKAKEENSYDIQYSYT